mgnify:FL=1
MAFARIGDQKVLEHGEVSACVAAYGRLESPVRMLNESVTRLPWCLVKRVLPQHTDHGGVMWHGAYVGWLEEARVEALSATGYPYEKMASNGLEMPVVQLQIRYREALMLGDEVELMSVSGAPRGVRWPWSTRFMKGGVCVAEAMVELVLLSVHPVRRVLRHPPEAAADAFRTLTEGPKENH